MSIGDKIQYKTDDYTYEAEVIAVKNDNTKVLISINGLGKVVEIDNE